MKGNSIKAPIGFICVQAGQDGERHPIAMAASHSNFGGNRTRVGRNAFGQICVSDGDGIRKPKIWKTEAGAQKRADEWHAAISNSGAGGNIGPVEVVAIYRSNREMIEAVCEAAWDRKTMISIVNHMSGE